MRIFPIFQAVGTDRNVNQSLLQHRAEMLSSLVRLFHCDIQTIYDQFSASGQYKNISEKLYHIFETYLPVLQYNANIFQNMPISKLPKVSLFIHSNNILHFLWNFNSFFSSRIFRVQVIYSWKQCIHYRAVRK